MSIFGNFGSTNNNAGGSVFGAQNTNQGATGTSAFGSTNPSTSTFGATNTNPAAPAQGGIFGAFGAAAPNNTTNQPATGTSLFGNNANPTNTTSGTSLFGNNNANTNTNVNAATGNTGSSIFGGNTGGSNLFGNAPNANLFGGAANTTASPGTGATGVGGIFGGGNTTNTTGGLFGSNTNNAQQQPGNTTGTSLFGSNPQQQTGNATGTMGTNLFGNTQTTGTNIFGAKPATGGANQQFIMLAQKVERIVNAWNQDSKDCEFQVGFGNKFRGIRLLNFICFQYNFYNLVDPKQVNLYGRPANATNDALWEKAVRENPDSSCLVPVIAIGFDDLRIRVDAQTAQSAAQLQNLKDLQTRLAALRTQHAVSNASRLLRAATAQTQVIQRLMRFIQHLHHLLPTIRSSALRPEEEVLRGKLEELEEEMRRGRVKGRLNELWALIGAVSASVERSTASGSGSGGDWAVVDEDGLAQIAQILTEQQAGLQHLTKILQKDQRDLNVIMGNSSKNLSESTGEQAGGGGSGGLGESLWGSTSTLRASSLR
ncbi:hypothetical protein CVT25_001662 [Psilocybe cyanescens]|uniref:Nucleoporin Nup54 alpha-helical domain-containing protein n=1 Tax=Psilocybe cyanescens TaxID=93625 RepID=A0A409XHJ0_PSICY|nr:hypothetical protein CVT25_001662 [Psilocybe cyanescens]